MRRLSSTQVGKSFHKITFRPELHMRKKTGPVETGTEEAVIPGVKHGGGSVMLWDGEWSTIDFWSYGWRKTSSVPEQQRNKVRSCPAASVSFHCVDSIHFGIFTA